MFGYINGVLIIAYDIYFRNKDRMVNFSGK